MIFVSSSSVLFKRDKSSRDIFPFSRNPVHVPAMTDRDLGVVPMQKVIAEWWVVNSLLWYNRRLKGDRPNCWDEMSPSYQIFYFLRRCSDLMDAKMRIFKRIMCSCEIIVCCDEFCRHWVNIKWKYKIIKINIGILDTCISQIWSLPSFAWLRDRGIWKTNINTCWEVFWEKPFVILLDLLTGDSIECGIDILNRNPIKWLLWDMANQFYSILSYSNFANLRSLY